MNNISLIGSLLILSFLSCNAQQSESRAVGSFNKIDVSGAVNIVYTDSDTNSLTIKGNANELSNVKTKVENSTLIISSEGNFKDNIYIYIKNSQLEALEASGAVEFKTTNQLPEDSMSVKATGAVNVQIKADAKKLSIQQSGASNVNLNGKTDVLTAQISGAATLKAYNMDSKNTRVTATGASSAKVSATETIKANASGASDIKIKGEPKEVSAEASSASSISRIKDEKTTAVLDSDTTTLKWKKKKLLVIKDPEKERRKKKQTNDNFKHWRGFSMAVNGYMGTNGSINMEKPYQFLDLNYSRSLNFQLNLIERHFNIVSNYFKVVTGMGFDFHQYDFANRTILDADTSFTWGVTDLNPGATYLKNKLRCTYLQVPLLLEFNTSNNAQKSFHVAFGVIGQYLISSRTKQVFEEDEKKHTVVKKDNYNLSPFGAKAHVNIGYRSWTLFGEYSLTPLFQSGRGPEVYPFAAGIRLVPFT